MQKPLSFILSLSLILTTLFNGEVSQAVRRMNKPTPKVSSVKITNVGKKLRIQKGKKFRLKTSVKVKPNKSSYKKLTFFSSNRKVVLVNSRGLVKGVKAGTAKITAASRTNPKKRASVFVSVTKDVLVSSIKLDRTKIITDEFNEDEIKLRVKKILPSTAKNKKVKWYTSDEEVADVDEEGVVTTGDAGTATIIAAAADQGGAFATCKVIVNENQDTGDDDSEETETPSMTTASCEPTPAVPGATAVVSESENPGETLLPSSETPSPTAKATAEPTQPSKEFEILQKASIEESETNADASFSTDGTLEISYTLSYERVCLDLGKEYDLSEYTGIEMTGKVPGQMEIQLLDDSFKIAGREFPFYYASCAWRFENGEIHKGMSVVNGFVASDKRRVLASEETCKFTWETLTRRGEGGDRSKIRYIYLKANRAPVAQEGTGVTNSDKYVIKSLKFTNNQINKDVLGYNKSVIFPRNEKGEADISYLERGVKFGSEETVAAWYLDRLDKEDKTEENHNTAFDMNEFSYIKVTVEEDTDRIDLKLAGKDVSYEDAVFVGTDVGIGARTLYFPLEKLKEEEKIGRFDTIQVCAHGGTVQAITVITGFPLKRTESTAYIVNPDGSKRELTEMDTLEWRPYYFDAQMTSDPFEPQGEGWEKVELSQWSGSSYCYSDEGKQIALDDTEIEVIPLPITMNRIGEQMEVIVRGEVSKSSEGFRLWIANSDTEVLTTQYYYTKKNGVGLSSSLDVEGTASEFHPGESFQIQTILAHTNHDYTYNLTSKYLVFKGPVYGEYMRDVVITSIWVRSV